MEDTLFEINQTGLSPMWYASIPVLSYMREGLTPQQERAFTGIH